MAKKNESYIEESAVKESESIDENEVSDDDTISDEFRFDTDFNIEDEYKPIPLVPSAAYEGYVTSVKFDASSNAIVWGVTINADADVLMSDNETPVNGNVLEYKNWLPKAGDENIRTKSGRMTKRQAKINFIQDFQKKMRIDMNTPEAILNGVNNQEWVGIAVIITVEVREWEGRFSNQIKEMVAA